MSGVPSIPPSAVSHNTTNYEDTMSYSGESEGKGEEEDDFEYEDDDYGVSMSIPAPVPLRREASDKVGMVTMSQMKEAMDEVVNNAVDSLGLAQYVAIRLLRHYRWNYGRMAEAYCEDPDAVLKAANCPTTDATAVTAPPPDETCSVCGITTMDADNSLALDCGHRFCMECWRGYITAKIDEGEVLSVRCMEGNTCPCFVEESTVAKVCDTASLRKWQKFVIKSFVNESPFMRWCPRPGCECGVRIWHTIGKDVCFPVKCACEMEFCFSCSGPVHVPATCSEVRKWSSVSNAESLNVRWVLEHTKDCPKCGVSIEKNQGCQHMTCRKCWHEFCWLCMGNWEGHEGCNAYVEGRSKRGEIDILDKFSFFFARFKRHEESEHDMEDMRFSAQDKTERIVAHAQESTAVAQTTNLTVNSSADVEFLLKCTDILIQCRRVLKWSYAVGYFMKECPEKALFLYRQNDLEATAEALMEGLKQPPKKLFGNRAKVIVLADVAQRRLDALLEGFQTGFTSGESVATKLAKK